VNACRSSTAFANVSRKYQTLHLVNFGESIWHHLITTVHVVGEWRAEVIRQPTQTATQTPVLASFVPSLQTVSVFL
jgi:hypothetical protein